MAATKNDALAAFDAFIETWGVKYDKAVECLIKDRDALLPSTTSRLSTGSICERPTLSKAHSRRSATEQCAPKDVSRTRPRSP